MSDPLKSRILSHLESERYRPQRPRGLARELNVEQEQSYHAFRDALKELMHQGRVVLGAGGTIVPPTQLQALHEFPGTYRHNKRGFGFVVPTSPGSNEYPYNPESQNGDALSRDI